jgi:DNA-binding transcriptional ArsR family regulator
VTTGVDADRVFAALADPRRRELLELLGRTPGCSASSLAARLPVSRQAVAQHLAVLEDSSLVSRRRAGREVLFSVRPEGLAATADWLTGRAAAWRERLRVTAYPPVTPSLPVGQTGAGPGNPGIAGRNMRYSGEMSLVWEPPGRGRLDSWHR